LRDKEAEKLINTVSDRLAERDAKTLSETLGNVEAEALFYMLAGMLTSAES